MLTRREAPCDCCCHLHAPPLQFSPADVLCGRGLSLGRPYDGWGPQTWAQRGVQRACCDVKASPCMVQCSQAHGNMRAEGEAEQA